MANAFEQVQENLRSQEIIVGARAWIRCGNRPLQAADFDCPITNQYSSGAGNGLRHMRVGQRIPAGRGHKRIGSNSLGYKVRIVRFGVTEFLRWIIRSICSRTFLDE